MSYTKNTWANGDVITAAKMNNIENGIAAAAVYDVVVKLDEEVGAIGLSDNDLHLIKGSYEECVQLIDAELPILACVYSYTAGDGNYAQVQTYTVDVYGYHDYGDMVQLNVKEYASNAYVKIYLTESGLSLSEG